MENVTGDPAESASQELRGIVDDGGESFAVDGIVEKAEEKEEKETPAAEEKPTEEKPGEEKPTEEKPGEKKLTEEKPGKEASDEKPPAEPVDEELPKGIKKRLATITRKRHDAERDAEATRAENAELRTKLDALEHPGSETEGEEPQIDNFDTEEEYLEAVTDWKADQKIAEREAAWEAEQEEKVREEQEATAQERQGAFKSELEKGVEKYEDFEDVIEDLNITGDMINILESLPNIPDIVYMLGNSPDTVKELVDLPFLQVAYKMKTISDGLAKKKNTKAPAPVKPVGTSGGVIKSLESMSMSEYNAYMDKKDKERKGKY